MPRPARGRGRPTAGKSPARTQSASSPDALARLPELLATPPDADLMAQFSAVAAETPGGPLALIDALGASRDEAAGRIAAAVAVAAPDKEQRKAARRALHRLRSSGVAVTMPVVVVPEPTTPAEQETLRPIQALVTPSDGVGSRLLWLLMERPRGGMVMFDLAINDVVGLKDAMIEDTTRRRFERRLAEWSERTEMTSVEVPVEYGLALLSEALALNAESGFPLPRDFVIRRRLLGTLPPPPTAALVHQHVSRGQVFLLPTLLEESGALLDAEPEFQGWIFSYGETEPYAREYRQAEESRLLLTSEPRGTRMERVIGSAVDALFTPELRRAFRRRLEETAYILWQSGRERAARQAVAAAFAIGDTGSLRTHPLLRQVVQRSIEVAIEVDRSGMPPPPGANRTARDRI